MEVGQVTRGNTCASGLISQSYSLMLSKEVRMGDDLPRTSSDDEVPIVRGAGASGGEILVSGQK